MSEKVRDVNKEAHKRLKKAFTFLDDLEEASLAEILEKDEELRKKFFLALFEFYHAAIPLLAESYKIALELSPEETRTLIKERLDSVDGKELGEVLNSLFVFNTRIWEENYKALQESWFKIIGEVLETTDFGKLRHSLTVQAEARYPILECLAQQIVGNPVIFANIFTILPPLLNMALRLISSAVSRIEFPPEILASAIFNTLEEISVEELASLINGLSKMVNQLHEGNLILGRDEPRFRQVADGMLHRMLQDLDVDLAFSAMMALSEDLETLIYAGSDAIINQPELLKSAITNLCTSLSAILRGATYAVDKVANLPPSEIREIVEAMEGGLDYQELGRLANSLVRLNNQALEGRPQHLEKVLSDIYGSLDRKELGKAVRVFSSQIFSFLANQEDLAKLLGPGEAGKILNDLIIAYNRSLGKQTSRIKEYASDFFQAIDSEELSQALQATATPLVEALLNNPKLVKKLAKTALSVVWKSARGYISSFRQSKRRR